jgi:hypothetical protein
MLMPKISRTTADWHGPEDRASTASSSPKKKSPRRTQKPKQNIPVLAHWTLCVCVLFAFLMKNVSKTLKTFFGVLILTSFRQSLSQLRIKTQQHSGRNSLR